MAERPNILFIQTDQQRFDTLGCYGNGVIDTPNIDELAQTGVRIADAHCTHPLCMPSRGTLLTGRYPSANGLWRNGIALPESETTIAERLRSHGYDTALIGKAHYTPYRGDPSKYPESVRVGAIPEKDCWEYWRRFDEPYYGFEETHMTIHHSDDGIDGGHYGLWLAETHPEKRRLFSQDAAIAGANAEAPSWKSAVPVAVHSTTWVADRTVEYVRADRSAPFFAWVGFPDPHFPFDPPEPYCDMYDPSDVRAPCDPEGDLFEGNVPEYVEYYRDHHPAWDDESDEVTAAIIARYYGMVSFVDDAVGRILDALESEGLADETLVVFTSDHGEWLGDHGLWNKGPIHTRGVTQVPLLFRWPSVTGDRETVTEPTSHIDVVPTLLDAAGVGVPYGVQGTSLREVLGGGDDVAPSNVLVEHRQEKAREGNRLAEQRRSGDRRIEHGWPWGDRDLVVKTLITDRYRYSHVHGTEDDYGELIDRRREPEGGTNLWGTEAEIESELRTALLDALVRADDPLPEREFLA